MSPFVTVQIGASRVDSSTGLPIYQAKNPVTDEETDAESFGEVAYYGALGVTALPWAKDDRGFAEALVARDVAGLDGAIMGFRDERSAKIYGALSPGDTAVHSTGPEQAAQLLLKETKRTAALITKDAGGKDIGIIIDGDAGEITLLCGGAALKLSADGVSFGIDAYTVTLDAAGQFVVNSNGGTLGGNATVASGIAYGPAGPPAVVPRSVGWFVSPI